MAAAHARTDRRDSNGGNGGLTVFPHGSFPSPDPSTAARRRRLDDIPLARPRRRGRRLLAAGGAVLSLGLPLLPQALTGSDEPTAATAVASIPSNFDTRPYIVSGNNGGNHPADASHEGPLGTGNFRSICHFSHLSYDDPIVYPGQPGKAHLHMFFGNTTANASSTYETLRAGGDGTCNGKPLNRSSYWIPALLNSSGNVVVPEAIATYYKSSGRDPQQVRAFPAGLKMIAGNDMTNPAAPDSHRWYCESAQSPDQKFLTIPDCPSNQLLIAQVIYPVCWNGRDLDSPDHRSHMAYAVRDAGGVTVCPSSHPVSLPEVTFTFFFRHSGSTASWYLSSDRMGGTQRPNGSTLHADWFGAWDPGVMDQWIAQCIHAEVDCQQGQLGNDTSLVWANTYSGSKVLPAPPNDQRNFLNPTTTTPAAPSTTGAPATTTTNLPSTTAPSTTAPSTTTASTTTVATTVVSPTTTVVGGAPSPAVGSQSRTSWSPLRLGSTGEYVRRVQSTLARIGHTSVRETKVYDQATVDAVLAEQKKWGSLPDTGTIDWDTGVHLGAFWPTDGPSAPTTTVLPSTTSSTVVPVTTTVVPSTTVRPTTTTMAPATTTTTVPSTPNTVFSPARARWTAATWKPLTLGSTGEYVRRVQRSLRKIGHTAVADTGIFDQATAAAVLAEQKKWSGLADTGTVEWATGQHLGIFW